MSTKRGTSKDYYPSIDKKMRSAREECLQTTGNKLLPSSSEDNLKVSHASYAKIASSNLPNNVTTPTSSTFQFSELVEEIASRIENLPFLQKVPFVTYAVKMSEYEKNYEDFFACGRNSNESFRKAPSNEQGIELGLHGQKENLRQYDGGMKSGQIEIGFENQNLLHSSGKNEPDIASERFLNGLRMEEIASESLATNHTNSVHFPNSQNPYFRNNPPLQDISLISGRLCPEVHRDIKNDFAVRIFAHIEYMNHEIYGEPLFYSNENVHKVVRHAWKGIKDYVINQTKFQMIDYAKFRLMCLDCTQSLFHEEGFDLLRFLSYCAKICQIGVQTMKCEGEHTQYYVTTLLRPIIKGVEKDTHSCFECTVESNADKIVELFRL